MSTDIKFSKTQSSKIIQSRAFIAAFKLADSLMKDAVSLPKNVLAPIATTSASAMDGAIKIHGQGVVRAGKAITLVIS